MNIHEGMIKNNAVRLVLSEQTWCEDEAVKQLVASTGMKGMLAVAGMPDLHPGNGYPVGASFLSKGVIYPALVGSDIGCGMGLWKTSIKRKKIKLDKWEKKLTGLNYPVNRPEQDLEERGLSPFCPGLEGYENKLGTIGGGNHFAEFQVIEEILDDENFIQAGLDADYVLLLVHSGSRGLGQKVLRNHLAEYSYGGIENLCRAKETYCKQHDYAMNWAKHNRAVIAERFCDRLGARANKLMDVCHNSVQRPKGILVDDFITRDEEHTLDLWLHRKGATPSDEGYVVIPGSRGALSYVVKPKKENIKQQKSSLFSLAHGAGRKWKRSECKKRLYKRFAPMELTRTELGNRVICTNRDLLYEEAPQAYKLIDQVITDLLEAGLVTLVASLRPVLTYKTREKK